MERDISKAVYRPSLTPETKIPVSDTPKTIQVIVQDYHDLYRDAFVNLLRIISVKI